MYMSWDEAPSGFRSLGELQSHEQKPGECMLIPDGYWSGMGGHRDMKRSEDGNLLGLLLPSGKLSHNYGKSPCFMGKSTISMAIFNSYVKLPEGMGNVGRNLVKPSPVWFLGGQYMMITT